MEKITAKKISENIFCNKVGRTKSGTFKIRRSYFYHSGITSTAWGEKVMARLKEAFPKQPFELVDTVDEWAAWPKTSYFMAEVRPI